VVTAQFAVSFGCELGEDVPIRVFCRAFRFYAVVERIWSSEDNEASAFRITSK
jgi:hypothetical protein